MEGPLSSPARITVALAGDVMLGRLVNDEIAARGFAYPWGDLLPTIHAAELFLINLECALTRHMQAAGAERKWFAWRVWGLCAAMGTIVTIDGPELQVSAAT